MVGDTGRISRLPKHSTSARAVTSGVMNIHNLRKYPDKLVFSIGEFASEMAN